MTVFFAGAAFFAAATGFLTIVEVLPSLEPLSALPLPVSGGGAGAAVLFPRPAPPVTAASVIFRLAAVPRVVLAFSTMFVSMPAAPPEGVGTFGFRGERGRARYDLPGEFAGRTGETGSARELADRGESTCDGWSFARDVVRSGGAGGPRIRFLGFSISSFSWSTVISSLDILAGVREE
jgi:hypothetical protein